MKAIILAAGQGTRLRPLTNNRPKCMVEFKGRQIIDIILENFHKVGISDITLVKGYKAEVLQKNDTKEIINKNYKTSNMVYSLFCTKDIWDEDLLISYSDIIYDVKHLNALITSKSKISVLVDKNWRSLWNKRMDNPLEDAETLKLFKNGYIKELGKKAKEYSEIEGQYMGLIKIRKDVLKKIKEFYENLDRNLNYDGKDFDNMYMTTFLQLIIDKLMPIKAVIVEGGWVEIDTLEDLKRLSC